MTAAEWAILVPSIATLLTALAAYVRARAAILAVRDKIDDTHQAVVGKLEEVEQHLVNGNGGTAP